MLPILRNSSKSLQKVNSAKNEISLDLLLNYNKSNLHRSDNVTSISIDRAVSGKGEFSHTRTYTQNLVKKYDLTGNKELCIRKILVSENEENLFDVTVREIKVYYRKEKKHHFNKVIRFKSPNGNIEFILDLLKNKNNQNHISFSSQYLLN